MRVHNYNETKKSTENRGNFPCGSTIITKQRNHLRIVGIFHAGPRRGSPLRYAPVAPVSTCLAS